MDEMPVYESRRSWKNFWQGYAVYRDRIELRSFFGRFRIMMEDVESIEVSPSLSNLIVKGQPGKAAELRSMKMDFADFCEHVALRTRKGMFRVFRFTPEEPSEFVYAALSALRKVPTLKPVLDEPEPTRLRIR
jgi:hypothetical protein